MKSKFTRFSASTAAVLLATRLFAAEAVPAPVPVAVLESEAFEAVGRLQEEGLSWFVDRADSNAPVLGAAIEVEAGGRTARAVFRAERGDYLIADADWLKPLRQPGEHALAMTVVAGEESDLIAGELLVAGAGKAVAATPWPLAAWAVPAALAAALFAWWRRRRGGAA
jgi:hypothetical protein